MTQVKNQYIIYVIVDGERVDEVRVPFCDLRDMTWGTRIKATDKVCFLSQELAERLFKHR